MEKFCGNDGDGCHRGGDVLHLVPGDGAVTVQVVQVEGPPEGGQHQGAQPGDSTVNNEDERKSLKARAKRQESI